MIIYKFVQIRVDKLSDRITQFVQRKKCANSDGYYFGTIFNVKALGSIIQFRSYHFYAGYPNHLINILICLKLGCMIQIKNGNSRGKSHEKITTKSQENDIQAVFTHQYSSFGGDRRRSLLYSILSDTHHFRHHITMYHSDYFQFSTDKRNPTGAETQITVIEVRCNRFPYNFGEILKRSLPEVDRSKYQ